MVLLVFVTKSAERKDLIQMSCYYLLRYYLKKLTDLFCDKEIVLPNKKVFYER
jgi:hypothetical protein